MWRIWGSKKDADTVKDASEEDGIGESVLKKEEEAALIELKKLIVDLLDDGHGSGCAPGGVVGTEQDGEGQKYEGGPEDAAKQKPGIK